MAKCSYLGCSNREISSSDDRVEVKTVLPQISEMTKMKSKLQIKWKRNGEAKFHRNCWSDLLKSVHAKEVDPKLPKLIAGEKVLLTEAAKTAEFFDSFDSVKESARRCASLLKSSKHCTAFTGAGISTSAGIGDFRGKDGQWTKRDHRAVNMKGVFGKDGADKDGEKGASANKKPEKSDSDDDEKEAEPKKKASPFSYESLRPTYTHEALQKLMTDGYLKYIISQNVDGLHALSGVPADKLSELHGNVFTEYCEKCGARYNRTYYVKDVNLRHFKSMCSLTRPSYAKRCETCGHCHRTGRKCEQEGCSGYLIDSIINFGDNLEHDILDRAVDNAKRSDFMLCLGSSLRVTPACNLVEMTKDPHNLAICNRQKTHMDRSYGNGVRVFGDCDDFMREVMREVLKTDDFEAWEDGRQKRMEHYATLRTAKK